MFHVLHDNTYYIDFYDASIGDYFVISLCMLKTRSFLAGYCAIGLNVLLLLLFVKLNNCICSIVSDYNSILKLHANAAIVSNVT